MATLIFLFCKSTVNIGSPRLYFNTSCWYENFIVSSYKLLILGKAKPPYSFSQTVNWCRTLKANRPLCFGISNKILYCFFKLNIFCAYCSFTFRLDWYNSFRCTSLMRKYILFLQNHAVLPDFDVAVLKFPFSLRGSFYTWPEAKLNENLEGHYAYCQLYPRK